MSTIMYKCADEMCIPECMYKEITEKSFPWYTKPHYRFTALPVSDLIFLLFFQISSWPERTNVIFSLTLPTSQSTTQFNVVVSKIMNTYTCMRAFELFSLGLDSNLQFEIRKILSV